MGTDIWHLPEQGTRTAHVYISRFLKFIVFIKENENNISDELWGLLYGHPLSWNKDVFGPVEDFW